MDQDIKAPLDRILLELQKLNEQNKVVVPYYPPMTVPNLPNPSIPNWPPHQPWQFPNGPWCGDMPITLCAAINTIVVKNG